jgi:CRP/FNR family transcriptional regulator, nitrogen fixation regulation protein
VLSAQVVASMQTLTAANVRSVACPASPLAYRIPASTDPSGDEQIDFGGTDLAFARNAQFYGEGDSPTYLYQITNGLARTYRMAADGRRQIIAFYVPGDLFGFEVGDSHSLSAEAVTAARARVIRRATIMNAAVSNEKIANQLWICLGREIHRNQDHILKLSEPAPVRIASFLLEIARRIPGTDATALPIPRQDIADYLNLRLETVSRTMTRIARSGAIELSNKRKITIRSRTTLSQMINWLKSSHEFG